MKIRNVPSAGLKRRSRGLSHCGFDRGQTPAEYENRQDRKRHPGPCNLPGGVGNRSVGWRSGLHFPFISHGVAHAGLLNRVRICAALFGESPDSLGPPNAQKDHRQYQGKNSRRNVHQIAIHVVGPKELHSRERESDRKNRGKHFERFLPAHHRSNQPEGHDHRGKRQDSADHLVQVAVRKARYRGQRVDGRTYRSPGHRRGVCD